MIEIYIFTNIIKYKFTIKYQRIKIFINFVEYMKTKIITITLAVIFTFNNCNTAFCNNKPKLIVQIIVDGLRYDNFIRYSQNYSKDGFMKLIKEGALYTNARSESTPITPASGIASITTGTTGNMHGIVGNDIVNYTTNDVVGFFEDKSCFGVGSLAERGMSSPKNLIIETVSDQLKLQSDSSKVLSIGTLKNSAIVAGGTNPDAVYYLDTLNLWFATSSYYMRELPKWLEQTNKGDLKSTISNKVWRATIAQEKFFNKNSEMLFKSANTSLIANLFRSKEPDYSKIAETPMLNDYAFEIAKKAILSESLGKDSYSDFVIITLSSLQDIIAKYGANSAETEDAYYKLDNNIQDIVTFLTKECGKDNFVITITASSGSSSDINISKNDKRNKSGYFNTLQFKIMMNSFLSTQFGYGDWITHYQNRQLYLNRKLIYEKSLSLKEIQDKCASFALQFKGVFSALTSETIMNGLNFGGVVQRDAKGYNPRFSGDIMITLMPNWIEIENEIEDISKKAGSGSGYEYDIHVPLIFYGKGIFNRHVTRDIHTTDIAATLCEMLQISRPNASNGQVLTEVINTLPTY